MGTRPRYENYRHYMPFYCEGKSFIDIILTTLVVKEPETPLKNAKKDVS